jgi:hypothetical protein
MQAGSIPPEAGKHKVFLADSIMKQVIFYAPLYENLISHYKAELYIKGVVDVRKKNQLLRWLPSMFRVKKGVRQYVMETYSDLQFTAPDKYDQKVKAAIGTSSRFWELDGHLPEYFHINIYSPTLLANKLLSPLARNAPTYYKYRLDSVRGKSHEREYRITFTPKGESFQLVSGYMIVSENVWSIREIYFMSRSEMFRLKTTIRMGNVGDDDEFLPKQYDIEAKLRFMGNVAYANYTAWLQYETIGEKAKETDIEQVTKKKNEYDLTDSYTLRTDTNAYIRDTTTFNQLRPVPLSAYEQSMYREYYYRNDTLTKYNKEKKESKTKQFWWQLGDALITRNTVNMNALGSIRFSPLINPVLFSYSHSRGISYKQQFRYNRLFTGDRLLTVRPQIGYNFKLHELYWSVNGDFEYLPSKRASLHVSVGNGNRIYSSDVLDDLKGIPDSIFDFSKIHLDYFRDLYLYVTHSWEIVNGLTLDVGFSSHRRSEVNRSQLVPITPEVPAAPDTRATRADDANENTEPPVYRLRHTYNSFAPRVRLTWHPGQYYYMNGARKINLDFKYPGISVEWERGLKGVFNSSGEYERWEVDMQYKLRMGILRNLYLRAGWGKFTRQKEMYFVDFTNFTRSNLPVGWNDEIGGVFQLLDSRWYNSSREYVRAHAVYESPFLLLRHLGKVTRYVLSERLYLNALAVPHLNPYLEAGYGIGTHIFDVGVFVSFSNFKYSEFGFKFTFELFNR